MKYLLLLIALVSFCSGQELTSQVFFDVDPSGGGVWQFSDRPGETFPARCSREVTGVVRMTFAPADGFIFVRFHDARNYTSPDSVKSKPDGVVVATGSRMFVMAGCRKAAP
jgi:hypothetical protein